MLVAAPKENGGIGEFDLEFATAEPGALFEDAPPKAGVPDVPAPKVNDGFELSPAADVFVASNEPKIGVEVERVGLVVVPKLKVGLEGSDGAGVELVEVVALKPNTGLLVSSFFSVDEPNEMALDGSSFF